MKNSNEMVFMKLILVILAINPIVIFLSINSPKLSNLGISVSIIIIYLVILFAIKSMFCKHEKLFRKDKKNTKSKLFKRYQETDLNNYFCIFFKIANLDLYKYYYGYEDIKFIKDEVATRLEETVGKKHFYSFGSNEYVIILEFDKSKVDNYEYRESFQKEKAEIIFKNISMNSIYNSKTERNYIIEITFGISSSGMRNEIKSIEELVKYADYALYNAEKGNKQFGIADDTLITEKIELDEFRDEIAEGFKDGEFVPFFQPLIDAKTTKIVGFESLVRWKKDKYRIIPPEKFLKAAEEKRILSSIDNYIILETLKSYKEWYYHGLINEEFKISINLSKNTLYSLDLKKLLKSIQSLNILPENIHFDLNEDILEKSKALERVEILKLQGFKISIDKFSSKNIPLKSLIDVNADYLKIDKSILPKDEVGVKQFRIYKTITNMAHNIGMKVVSTGVENKTQLDFVKMIGVDAIQGYYFSEALDKEKFSLFLEKYKTGIYV